MELVDGSLEQNVTAGNAIDPIVFGYQSLYQVNLSSFPEGIGFEKDEEELNHIIQVVTEAKPHILVVGLGCPKQEKFIYKYRNDLKVPVSLGLGASIDFEAGIIKRAPKWMADHGFEWLYRVVQDPKRLMRRYFIDDVKIIKMFFKYRLQTK